MHLRWKQFSAFFLFVLNEHCLQFLKKYFSAFTAETMCTVFLIQAAQPQYPQHQGVKKNVRKKLASLFGTHVCINTDALRNRITFCLIRQLAVSVRLKQHGRTTQTK